MDNASLWGVIILLPIWAALADQALYMDTYGHCNMDGYYPISDETVTLSGRGGGQAYKTMICVIKFRAERDEQICIIFDKLSINERGTNLLIFDGQLSSGEPKYNLGQRSSASSLCSTGRYLTVKLEKENYRSTSYQFKLRILEESQTDGLINGLNGFVMSVGVIIAIIICVVVLITVFAVVIVCCCCKTGGITQSKGIKMNRQSGPQQGCSNQRPAPSAPPLQEYGHDGYHSVPIQDGEPPPAYSEQPPPYTTTDIPS
ncbi:uncharacterized protein LOC127707035 [Mytilus californianus]|uniref:uncharacterized protein LOC127707035 n=1 Tax=Mytilus californianus TaxID=6549 RepID=UPI0022475F90|nr:uncharacterized protein LOC127707035 [Mytilus californianus]